MSSFEYMARLPEGGPHTAPNIHIDLWVTESDLQGLTALAHWIHGFQCGDAGHRAGTVPGYHDLIQVLRRINSEINHTTHGKGKSGSKTEKPGEAEDQDPPSGS